MDYFVDCIRCGYCCGYRRNGHSDIIHEDGVKVPVDEDGVCIHMEKLDNGFTKCKVHGTPDQPKMCKLYNCLTIKKVRYLETIVKHLKEISE